jgi:serine/threonine protein kinase
MATSFLRVETGPVLGGRYLVGPRLGGGGIAEVFLGHDRRLDREVAIKVLRPDKAAVPSLRRGFAIEGRATARLSHPNVVGVYDVGEDGGNPYLIMELVRGRALAEHIMAGPLAQDVVCRIGLDVLAGLGAAHMAGILHRDVKPANVLIDERGTAKLADFGIAKLGERSSGSDATATAMVIGTPGYLAPERAAGDPASTESDLWAVGVVLYEALTAAKPFEGPTPLAAALAAANGNYVPLQVRRPDIDPELAGAIQRALNPDHAARYPSAAAMADSLQRLPRWGSPARADEAAHAAAAIKDTAVLSAAPTEMIDADLLLPRAMTPRTRKVLTRLAIGTGIGLSAFVLTWALVATGPRRIAHQAPTTIVQPHRTTIPVTTTPPTTAPPPQAHNSDNADHENGNGNDSNGDGNDGDAGGD